MNELLKILEETTTLSELTESVKNSMPYFWQYFLPFAIIGIIIVIIGRSKKRK